VRGFVDAMAIIENSFTRSRRDTDDDADRREG
jgi:hypothetical protein